MARINRYVGAVRADFRAMGRSMPEEAPVMKMERCWIIVGILSAVGWGWLYGVGKCVW